MDSLKITEWFNELSLVTQTCIKKSDLNFNHGRFYILIFLNIFLNLKK